MDYVNGVPHAQHGRYCIRVGCVKICFPIPITRLDLVFVWLHIGFGWGSDACGEANICSFYGDGRVSIATSMQYQTRRYQQDST